MDWDGYALASQQKDQEERGGEATICQYCHKDTHESELTSVAIALIGVELNYLMCNECKKEVENEN